MPTHATPIQTTPKHSTYLYYHSPPHHYTHTCKNINIYEPIPMAHGISLSEEQQQQQSHPIYKALRALFEQGTTAPSNRGEYIH